MSGAGHGGHGGHDDHGAKKENSSYGGIIIAIILGFIFIIILKVIFFPSNKGEETNKNNNSQPSAQQYSPSQSNKYSDRITVQYGPNYGNIVNIPSGCNFFFISATRAYCCLSGSAEVCGIAGEDASVRLDDSHANMNLRFKSTDGGNGSLIIIVTQK